MAPAPTPRSNANLPARLRPFDVTFAWPLRLLIDYLPYRSIITPVSVPKETSLERRASRSLLLSLLWVRVILGTLAAVKGST